MIIFVSLQAYSVLLFGKLFRIKKQNSFPKRKLERDKNIKLKI